jgi:hypothetical protein
MACKDAGKVRYVDSVLKENEKDATHRNYTAAEKIRKNCATAECDSKPIKKCAAAELGRCRTRARSCSRLRPRWAGRTAAAWAKEQAGLRSNSQRLVSDKKKHNVWSIAFQAYAPHQTKLKVSLIASVVLLGSTGAIQPGRCARPGLVKHQRSNKETWMRWTPGERSNPIEARQSIQSGW